MEEKKPLSSEEIQQEAAAAVEPQAAPAVDATPTAEVEAPVEETPKPAAEPAPAEPEPTPEEPAAEAAPAEEPAAEPTPEEPKAAEPAPAEEPAPAVESAEPEAAAEPAAEAPAPAEEPAPEPAAEEPQEKKEEEAPKTKREAVERLRIITEAGLLPARQVIDKIKQVFYNIHNAETEAEKKAFVEAGGKEEDFKPTPDPDEEVFKAQLDLVKELRAKEMKAREEQSKENLKRKLEIIELIKSYAESPDKADANFNEVKKLQTEWKERKAVPPENASELWTTYQFALNQFYDQLHLNREARAYDFKKNLEAKTKLCEAAEKLADVEDPVSAFHQLQNLHDQFREIGPVGRENREEIWKRFKAASTVVNKRHQEYFLSQKEQEEENLKKKEALCEELEGVDVEAPASFKAWNALTEKVLELQKQWRSIGFATRKQNTAVYQRFRKACDRFFEAKSTFMKAHKTLQAEALAKKEELVKAAEELKADTNWNETAKKFTELQKQWKEIGHTAAKSSEALWERFHAACNDFFAKRNEAVGGRRQEEEANLEKKNDVIARLQAAIEKAGDKVSEEVHALQDEWQSIGFVPFKKKEKLQQKYRELIDRAYDELHIQRRRRSVENFRQNIAEKDESDLSRELRRLQDQLAAKQSELNTYETNLSYFRSTSKSGNSLLADIEKKVEKMKGEIETLKEKIKVVREQAKAEKTAAEAPAAAPEAPAAEAAPAEEPAAAEAEAAAAEETPAAEAAPEPEKPEAEAAE